MSDEELNNTPQPPEEASKNEGTPDPAPPPVFDPVAGTTDEFERLLGAPHNNLATALSSHGFTLDRIFHRLAMYGAGSKAKTIDLALMELALQTQHHFRRTYETIKRIEREEQEHMDRYLNTRNRGF